MADSHGGGGGMIRTILIWLAVIIAVLLVLLWLVTGGVHQIVSTAKTITNPIAGIFNFATSSGSAFRLPWQPDYVTPQIPEMNDSDADSSSNGSSDSLGNSANDYDALAAKARAAKDFGTPSPYRGQVTIDDNAAYESDPLAEYVTVSASGDNSAPVDITGWSLQSAVTGVRGYVPRGAPLFFSGVVNTQTDISVNPGTVVILASGYSPVGTSFRENLCSGYLSQFQDFSPSLSLNCPAASDSLPLSADNLQLYGENCFDYVGGLPQCTFPTELPNDVSPACRIFLQNNLSYNGCVQNYRYKSAFLKNQWRAYLSAGGELWRNSHDVIRLLDKEGRTVDVLSY